jgi:5S rRNA maturation endonuclease (ribonuclease M5)
MPGDVWIHGAVEGDLDEIVLRKLAAESGCNVRAVIGKKGKDYIKNNLNALNRSASELKFFVLLDFDNEATCVPRVLSDYLPSPAKNMCLRFAVSEIEAWLLADREMIADALRVSLSKIPQNPDQVDYPKQLIVSLARKSKRNDVKFDLVPREGTSNTEGPGYTLRMSEFVHERWRPNVARRHSDSLNRCLNALERLKEAE